jgi:hypothetical protein
VALEATAQRHGAEKCIKAIQCMIGGEGDLWTVIADGIDREPSSAGPNRWASVVIRG